MVENVRQGRNVSMVLFAQIARATVRRMHVISNDCEEDAGPCMCALQLCATMAGSSCSPAVLDDAENSHLVVCPE